MSEIKLPAASGGGSISIKGPASSGSDVDLLDTSGNLAISGTSTLTGNVGIGVSAAKKLHVKGSDNIFRLETTDSTGKCTMTFSDPSGQKAYFGYGSGASDTFYIAQQENADIQVHTNNTERLRIQSSGDVKVVTGSVIIGTSGEGIDFSATSGTGTSERLEDYEEGTWGSFNGNAISSGTISYGVYTKIGNLVHVQAKVGSMTVGTGSHAVELSLPFAVDSNYNDSAGSVFYQYIDTVGKDVCSYGYDSVLRMYRMSDDGNWTVLIGDHMNSGGTTNFIVNHTYFTAA